MPIDPCPFRHTLSWQNSLSQTIDKQTAHLPKVWRPAPHLYICLCASLYLVSGGLIKTVHSASTCDMGRLARVKRRTVHLHACGRTDAVVAGRWTANDLYGRVCGHLGAREDDSARRRASRAWGARSFQCDPSCGRAQSNQRFLRPATRRSCCTPAPEDDNDDDGHNSFPLCAAPRAAQKSWSTRRIHTRT